MAEVTNHNSNVTYILNLPAAPPPPGYTVNYLNEIPLTKAVKIDASLCFVIATLAFAMRMYTKLAVMREFVLEDYMFVLSQCLFTAFMGVHFKTIDRGIYHLWDLKVMDLEFFLWWFRIVAVMYGIALAAIKVVILLQYLRIFAPTKQNRVMYWTCHILIWVNVIFYTLCTLLEIFHCRPLHKAWDPVLLLSSEGSCYNITVLRIGTGAVNVLSDILLLLLPQHAIWRLQMTRGKKIGISALFGFGILACLASIFRLYYSVRLVSDYDQIRSTSLLGFWIGPEVVCGILVAALPVTPRFFKHLRDTWFGEKVAKSYGSVCASFTRRVSGTRLESLLTKSMITISSPTSSAAVITTTDLEKGPNKEIIRIEHREYNPSEKSSTNEQQGSKCESEPESGSDDSIESISSIDSRRPLSSNPVDRQQLQPQPQPQQRSTPSRANLNTYQSTAEPIEDEESRMKREKKYSRSSWV